jgi:hypothetical protein
MTASGREVSPKLLARMAGLFFLLTILAGIFAQGLVSERLILFSDASATATNILSHKGLFQLGLTVYLIEMACQIATITLFYVLLRPVSRNLNLLSTVWGLAGSVIKIFARVFYIASLFPLGGSRALSSFSVEQLQQLALILLRINDLGAAVALGFFGLETTVKGYLIFRSTFLPRWLGVLSIISGAGWLTFLYPPLGYRAFPIIALIGLVGSVAMIFWLLVFGVNEQRWIEQENNASRI